MKGSPTGGAIFIQGDIAETLMYIQKGRVKLSVASKTNKVAVNNVAIKRERIS